MNKSPIVAQRSLLWNMIPFAITWTLLTATAAGFINTAPDPQGLRELPRLVLILGSIVVGLLGTVAVSAPIAAISLWSLTKKRRLQMFAIFPLLLAELAVGLLVNQPILFVALFGFLQWVYWAFIWFIRDSSTPTTNPDITTKKNEPEPPQVTTNRQPETHPIPSTSEMLDTDTTIENLEASMADLAEQILKENET